MDEYKLFKYRWDIKLLAKLYVDHGSRVVIMHRHFGISRGILKSSLKRLMDADLIMENPGHGHPMRAEYILTAKGQLIAPFCLAVLEEGRKRKVDNIFESKWSCPIIIATGEQKKRFNELKRDLNPVTSKALSTNLKSLSEIKCLKSEIFYSNPPSFIYSLDRNSRGIFKIYKEHENSLTALEVI